MAADTVGVHLPAGKAAIGFYALVELPHFHEMVVGTWTNVRVRRVVPVHAESAAQHGIMYIYLVVWHGLFLGYFYYFIFLKEFLGRRVIVGAERTCYNSNGYGIRFGSIIWRRTQKNKTAIGLIWIFNILQAIIKK